jgi:peptidoglycan/LPS O-acetylase OafA/YrhL
VLDWLKALGMCLIVYGHVAAATVIADAPPVYVKQFGVAFFLFATAYTLARETRPSTHVLFNRLFRMYLFGIGLALLITVLSLITSGRWVLSNYLPFLGGANVVFDNFPANPTTWYIGTYLHFLVLWAVVLRRLRARAWMVFAAVAVEIPIRAALMMLGGGFVAYMSLANWVGTFMFGLVRGTAPSAKAAGSAAPFVGLLAVGLLAAGVAGRRAGLVPTFPFMTIEQAGFAGALLVSVAVSMLYFGVTALTFEAARRVRAPAPVRFISRNSLVIFLAHMPVMFLLHPWLVSLGLTYWSRVLIQMAVALVGLGLISEFVVAVLQPDRLRDRIWRSVIGQDGVRVSNWPLTWSGSGRL